MRFLPCQHSVHVEQLSVLRSCSGHKIVSAGTSLAVSTEIVLGTANVSGAFEKRISKRPGCGCCFLRAFSATAIGYFSTSSKRYIPKCAAPGAAPAIGAKARRTPLSENPRERAAAPRTRADDHRRDPQPPGLTAALTPSRAARDAANAFCFRSTSANGGRSSGRSHAPQASMCRSGILSSLRKEFRHHRSKAGLTFAGFPSRATGIGNRAPAELSPSWFGAAINSELR